MADATIRADIVADVSQWGPNIQAAETGIASFDASVMRHVESVKTKLSEAEAATLKVKLATDSYTTAIARFGPESRQAESALLRLSAAQKDAEGSAGSLLGSLKALNPTSLAVGALAGAIAGLGVSIFHAGEEAHKLEVSLRGAFGDSAEHVSQVIRKLSEDISVFSDQDLARASGRLEKFGSFSESNLKLVADSAARFGLSVEDVATKLGQLEAFSDERGFTRTLRQIQRQCGATSAELAKLGAHVDHTGKLLNDTTQRIEDNRQAMEKWMAANTAGAAERMSTEVDKLARSWNHLEGDIGATLVKIEEKYAPILGQFIDLIRVAGEGIGVLDAQAQPDKPEAMPRGNAPKVTLAADAGAQGALVTSLEAQLAAAKQAGDKMMQATLQQQLDKARESRDRMRAQMQAGEGEESVKDQAKEAKQASRERVAAMAEEIRQIHHRAEIEGLSHKQELENYKMILDSGRLNGQEMVKLREAVEGRIAELTKQTREEETKAAQKAQRDQEKALRDKFKITVDTLKEEAAAHRITRQQEIDGLKDVLQWEKLTAQQRLEVKRDIDAAQGAINRDKKAADRKAEAERKKAERLENKEGREIGAAQKQGLEAQRQDAEDARRDAEKRRREAKTQQDVNKASLDAQAAIKTGLDLKLREIDLERQLSLASATSASVKAAVNEAAEQKIKAARNEATRALRQDVDEQRKAVDELQKAKDRLLGRTEMTGQVMSLEEFAQQSHEQFGSEAVARQMDLGTAFNRANSPAGPRNELTYRATPTPQELSLKTPTLQQQADALGKSVATSLAEMSLTIHNQVTVGGQTQTATRSGPVRTLAQEATRFNPAYQPGRTTP